MINKKQLTRKLMLNKMTVSDLSTAEKRNVKGGYGTYDTCYETCNPCDTSEYPYRTCPCPFVMTFPASMCLANCDGECSNIE